MIDEPFEGTNDMTIFLVALIILLIAYYFKPVEKYCVYEISGHENSHARSYSLNEGIKKKKVKYQLGDYILEDGEIIHSKVKIFDSLEAAKLNMEFCKQYMNVQGAFYRQGCGVVYIPKHKYSYSPYHEMEIRHSLIDRTWTTNEILKT